jgi:hypothetical protein
VPTEVNDPPAKAFRHTAPRNPLRNLNDLGRKYVWLFLFVYAEMTSKPGNGNTTIHPLERIAITVADAAKLGAELESKVFRGQFSDELAPFTAGYEDLPTRLAGLSARLGGFLDSMGKPGHKHKTMATQWLIQASELVRLQTGQHYDEHLSELFQAIDKRRCSENLSGDAIRKKRRYAKKHYPELYAHALKVARKVCKAAEALEPANNSRKTPLPFEALERGMKVSEALRP